MTEHTSRRARTRTQATGAAKCGSVTEGERVAPSLSIIHDAWQQDPETTALCFCVALLTWYLEVKSKGDS
jgi:hypothetical protein